MTFAPRTWVVGEVVTAALLNTEIRDQFNSFFGAWTDYTPTWTADAGTTTLGNGALAGRYLKVGRAVDFAIRLDWGSTSTQSVAGENWNFALPVPAYAGKGVTWQPVDAWILDSSVGTGTRWLAAGYIDPSSSVVKTITADADGGSMDSQEMPSQIPVSGQIQPSSINWATGDRLNIWGRYEAAS